MERGRRENVGAKGLHYTRVQLPVSFQQHDKRGAAIVAGADELQEKFPNGLRPETRKMFNVPPVPTVEQGTM